MNPKINLLRRCSFYACSVAIAFALLLTAGCDSGGNNNDDDNNTKTQFKVKYEVTGSCDNIMAVGYTVNGGGATGDTAALPWTHVEDFTVTGPFTAVALSASCSSTGAINSLTARLLVDDVVRDTKSVTGMATISISVSTLLN